MHMLLSFWDALRLRLLVFGILFMMSPLFLCASVFAQSNSAISQRFQAGDAGITPAALVSVKKDNPGSIELSDATNVSRLIGVVGATPLIGLSDGESGLDVVTSGNTVALISDLNGKVETGDKITASPIAGVGMKAIDATTIVGVAQTSLDSVQTETREITDKQGKKRQVKIGLLHLQVAVASYAPEVEKQSSFVPPFLQSIANSVSGRNVSPMRVLIATLILVLLFLSITVLLYSSVRSSIISIGRNPLSESAVRKSLFQVGLTVLAMLIFAVAIVYLVLTV